MQTGNKIANKGQKGQLMIEALVAIALVSLSLVTLLSISLKSLRVQLLNKQWNQAGQLEQEALEAIRQIRDGNGKIKLLDDSEIDWEWDNANYDIWDEGSPTYFIMYYDQTQNLWIMQRSNESDPLTSDYNLAYDASTNRFGYPGVGGFPSTALSSPFYRQLVLNDRTGIAESKSVTCRLIWREGERYHETKLESIVSLW